MLLSKTSSFIPFLILIEFQDDSRYSAGRGVHINLKRAERARLTVNKIPGTVFFRIHYCIFACSTVRTNNFSFQQL